jgi:hypothetical protein
MNVNMTVVRNIAIVMGIAALVFVSQRGFGAVAVSLNQIIFILFVAGIAVMAYQYFRQNELAWMVIPAWQRKAIVGLGIAILLLLTLGIPLLGPHISALGVIALAAACALAIVWMVRRSRRWH